MGIPVSCTSLVSLSSAVMVSAIVCYSGAKLDAFCDVYLMTVNCSRWSVKLVAQLFIVCVVGIFFILYQCFVVKTPLMSHPLNCPADHVHLSSRRPCYGRAGPLLNSTTAGSFQVSE